MAHLFKKKYSVELDFGSLTIKKLIDFVFTEMIDEKIQELVQQERAKRSKRGIQDTSNSRSLALRKSFQRFD